MYRFAEEINTNLNIVPRRCFCFYKFFKTFEILMFYLTFTMIKITGILLHCALYNESKGNSFQTETTSTDSFSEDEDKVINIIIEILIIMFEIFFFLLL